VCCSARKCIHKRKPHKMIRTIRGLHHMMRCNTLQHIATHCNTTQHTATRCNTPNEAASYDTQFSKTSIILIFHCKLSSEQTFENLHLSDEVESVLRQSACRRTNNCCHSSQTLLADTKAFFADMQGSFAEI